jgi:hypothetical protein
MHTRFWTESVKEGDCLSYLGADRRIILKCIFKKQREYGDWIHLDQDRVQWRVFVNTVMKLRVLYKAGNFLTS